MSDDNTTAMKKCGTCGGPGLDPDCPDCNGIGYVEIPMEGNDPQVLPTIHEPRKRKRRTLLEIEADRQAAEATKTNAAGAALQHHAAVGSDLKAKVSRALLGLIARHWEQIEPGDGVMPTLHIKLEQRGAAIEAISYDFRVTSQVSVSLDEEPSLPLQ